MKKPITFNFKFQIATIIATAFTLSCESVNESNDNSSLLTTLLALDNQARIGIESSKQCETSYNNSATNDLGNLIQLCTPQAGRGRHFRFEDVGMSANNGYLNLLIGYGQYTEGTSTEDFPQSSTRPGSPLAPTTTTDDGRWRIFFGKSTSCNKVWFVPNFSGTNSNTITLHDLFMTESVSTTLSPTSCPSDQGGENISSGIWGPSTICMDVTKGKSGSGPRITVWATGKNGADCKNLSTLTSSNSIYSKNDWTSKVETKDDKVYIYRSNDSTTMSKVIVRSETAIQD